MNDIKKEQIDNTLTYAFYSRLLDKVFDTVESLKDAEATYAAELKAKEDKAATKKADAQKVEDAFKALNAARKDYKERLAEVTKVYSEGLATLKTKFEESRTLIQEALAEAEATYATALKEFTDKYETYHLSLKDGDFETTICGNKTATGSKASTKAEPEQLSFFDLFDYLFR